ERAIRLKIDPLNEYPLSRGRTRGLPDLELADPVEVLIVVMAHEIGHIELFERTGSRREFETEQLARMVFADFRRRRAELMAGWGDPGPGPVRPRVVYACRCDRCGQRFEMARRPRKSVCTLCFKSYAEGEAAGAFIRVEKVSR